MRQILTKIKLKLAGSNARTIASVLKRTNGRVFAGPCSGMVLPNNHYLAKNLSYIVGCYECEIHPFLYSCICNEHSQFIDIGAAYGYYVVGMALKLPLTADIIAYEGEPDRQAGTLQLAQANNVKHIKQYGFCDIDHLKSVLKPRAFILVDCEGNELDFLFPNLIPALSTATIVCELHDFFRPGATQSLIQRFLLTHKASIVDETSRLPENYRVLNDLPKNVTANLIAEKRKFPASIDPNETITFGQFLILTPI